MGERFRAQTVREFQLATVAPWSPLTVGPHIGLLLVRTLPLHVAFFLVSNSKGGSQDAKLRPTVLKCTHSHVWH